MWSSFQKKVWRIDVILELYHGFLFKSGQLNYLIQKYCFKYYILHFASAISLPLILRWGRIRVFFNFWTWSNDANQAWTSMAQIIKLQKSFKMIPNPNQFNGKWTSKICHRIWRLRGFKLRGWRWNRLPLCWMFVTDVGDEMLSTTLRYWWWGWPFSWPTSPIF